jgi:Ca-activated chloride channel family protein
MSAKQKSTLKITTLKLALLFAVLLFGAIYLTTGLKNAVGKIATTIFLYRGNWAYKNGDFDDAGVFYASALKNNPLLWKAQYNLGNAYYKQGRYHDAARVYKQSITNKYNKLKAESWNNLGNAYYMQHNLNASAESFKTALLISNSDLQIRKNYLFVLNLLNPATANDGLKKKENKNQLADNKNNKKGEDGKKDKKTEDKSPESYQVSDKTIADFFNRINKNEDAARGRVNNTKLKNNTTPTNQPDY